MLGKLLRNISIIFWMLLGMHFVVDNNLIKDHYGLLVLIIFAIMIFVIDIMMSIVKFFAELFRR